MVCHRIESNKSGSHVTAEGIFQNASSIFVSLENLKIRKKYQVDQLNKHRNKK